MTAIRFRVNGYAVLTNAVETALESAMNRTDKYLDEQFSLAQRDLMHQHLSNYFWLAIEESGVEVK